VNEVKVYTALLQQLAASPMWQWDTAPSMWAVLNDDDPVIVTPVFQVSSVSEFVELAHVWRANVGGAVAVQYLLLVVEAWENSTDGKVYEIRDLVSISHDGATTFLRFYRHDGSVKEMDPMTSMSDALSAVREVGAAAWE
jgi:hypothetical protein